jgi:signal transduction histidine kinase
MRRFTNDKKAIKKKTRKIAKAKRCIAPTAIRHPPASNLKERPDLYLVELEEVREQQAASAEILKVISRSTFDLDGVLTTLTRSAADLCKANRCMIWLRSEDKLRFRAQTGYSPGFVATMSETALPIAENATTLAGLSAHLGTVAVTTDAQADERFSSNPMLQGSDNHAMLAVPLLRDGNVVGTFGLARSTADPFTKRQIEIVQTYADQAVIAIENARLLKELSHRTEDLTRSLEDLRAAQDRLVQTEKLASLGQLTAGIAHEIKNPLNFVNNFSGLSVELIDELEEALAPAALDPKTRSDVNELTLLLKGNLEKVVQHGKRADTIVKNMLLHSRVGSGEHRSADVNGLVDESLNLAYHGARAEKPDFHITLTRDFDPSAGSIELYPQEITRALLNLISNGFYAANQHKSEAGDKPFDPLLSVATKNLGETVEIRIRDNGIGILPEVKEKMFNPFFTTKPAGEGTGLGLSMSHDILVEQHGGRIDVETVPGLFTEFIITLRRNVAPPL